MFLSLLKTILSSKRISPLVGVSRPAIIRRVVVFPQPEEPRRVTKEPSSISRFRSLTPMNLPHCLVTCVSTIFGMVSFLLHPCQWTRR